MKFKANLVEKPGNFQMDDCQIEKVVELTREEFYKLKITPSEKQPFITENKSCMYSRDGILHCLLALGPDSNDGVLIEVAGYDYARLAAYIPGMRDILNAEMDRAADFVIRQGAENSVSGSWCVYFDELAEQFGLTLRDGNGLDSMLRAALKRRPEIAAVDMHDGCIEMEYHPEYCQRFRQDSENDLPGLRFNEAHNASMGAEQATEPVMGWQRDITMGHCNSPLSSHHALDLIATYEELYHIPESERLTYYFGDCGGHFLKRGTAEDAALAAYEKALAAIGMDSDAFLQSKDFIYRGGIIARMWGCMLGEDARLQDALDCWAENRDTVLRHEDAPDCCVAMEDLAKLTPSGREDFAALLGARVREIRCGDTGIEVVVSDVEPQELARFCESYDAFMEAEQAMGPMM